MFFNTWDEQDKNRYIKYLKEQIKMLNGSIKKIPREKNIVIPNYVRIRANTVLIPIQKLQDLLTGDINTPSKPIDNVTLLYFLRILESTIIEECKKELNTDNEDKNSFNQLS